MGFLLGLLVVVTGIAQAQPPAHPEARGVAPAAVARAAVEGHGWMTIRDDRDQSTILLHLPPRTAGGDEPGTVRIAPGVAGQTDAVASFGDRVWLALAPERGAPGNFLRRVVTLSAARSIGGSWEYPPGRPEVLPPLPGRDDVVGFVGTAKGPVALTRSRVDHAAPAEREWSLQFLAGSAWRSLTLPWPGLAEIPGSGATVRLIGLDSSIGVLVFPNGPGPVTVLRADVPSPTVASPESELPVSWTGESWPVDGPEVPGNSLSPDAVLAVGSGRNPQLIAATWRGGSGALELVALRRSGAALLATVEGVPREHRIASLNSNDSVAILWWEVSGRSVGGSEPVPGSTASRSFTIAEVSAITGRVLYRGEHKGGGMLSGGEFRLLALSLLLVTTLVLLFALRAEPAANLTMPDGYVLADPLRRIFAAAADLVPGIVIAAFSMGLEPEAMLSPTILIGPRADPMAWVLALGLTIIHCTVGEAMTGRSIGKALTGCEVVSWRRDRESGKVQIAPVAAWQALVRNLIRWGFPILGILLLIDGGRRHPADAAAGTAVVVQVHDDDEE